MAVPKATRKACEASARAARAFATAPYIPKNSCVIPAYTVRVTGTPAAFNAE